YPCAAPRMAIAPVNPCGPGEGFSFSQISRWCDSKIEVSPTSANPPETVSIVTVSPESTVRSGGIFASRYPQWTVAGVGPSLCVAMEVILLKFRRFSCPTPQDADGGPASPLRGRSGCLETQTVPKTE